MYLVSCLNSQDLKDSAEPVEKADFAARALKAMEEKNRYNFSWVPPPPARRLNVFFSKAKFTLSDRFDINPEHFEGQMFSDMNKMFWTVETV